MQEAGEALPWYASAPARPPPAAARAPRPTSSAAAAPSSGEVQPAGAGDEQHGRERRGVHHRRAEVRLQEDEPHRDRAQPDGGQRRCASEPIRRDRSARKPATASTKSDLPELGRLELERADHEPALRAADRRPRDEDEDHQPDRPGVDRRASSRCSSDGGTSAATTNAKAPSPAAIPCRITSWRGSPGTSKRVMPAIAQSP